MKNIRLRRNIIEYTNTKKIKKEKGITLIALVITIIVLLILAGVTIATLTGNNGILTKANEAKTNNTDSEASEQFSLLANEWIIEKSTGDKTLEKFLEEKRKEEQLSEVKDNGDGSYTIKQNGYQTIIDQNGKIGSVFNPEEWDKTAASEDCFIWGSDTEGEEGYDVVVGYTQNIEGYTKLRFPSRCTKIDLRTSYANESNDSSRSFCSSIKTIELPDTVVEIGKWSFASSEWATGFDNLESIIIPDSVTKIGYNAFYSCKNLKSITIPDSVTSIDGYAFMYCTNLSSITIPNSVTSIGNGAFSDCTSLSNITIPSSVISMSGWVFASWTSSQTINIKGYSSAPASWNESWNDGCSAQINWNQ